MKFTLSIFLIIATSNIILVHICSKAAISKKKLTADKKAGVAISRSSAMLKQNNTQTVRIYLEGANISIIIPIGWEYGWGSDNQTYNLYPNNSQSQVNLYRYTLNSDEMKMSPKELLLNLTQEYSEYLNIVSGPDEFNVNSYKAGKVILKSTVPLIDIMIYIGNVFVGNDDYIFSSFYPSTEDASIRAGIDMALSSFHISNFVTETNNTSSTLSSQLIGCWEIYNNDIDRLGNVASQNKVVFMEGSRYIRSSFTSATVPGSDTFLTESKESGAYSVQNNIITANPDTGPSYSVNYSLEGGSLYLNNVRYIPCV